ncbi:flagellar hook-basal body complex protein FliE, partial [Mixta calida]
KLVAAYQEIMNMQV